MRLTPSEHGLLYLFSGDATASGDGQFNIIYPTPKRNSGLAEVIAGQQTETGWNVFGSRPGTDIVWIIWSRDMPEVGEKAKTLAFAAGGTVADKSVEGELKTYILENTISDLI